MSKSKGLRLFVQFDLSFALPGFYFDTPTPKRSHKIVTVSKKTLNGQSCASLPVYSPKALPKDREPNRPSFLHMFLSLPVDHQSQAGTGAFVARENHHPKIRFKGFPRAMFFPFKDNL